MELWQGTHHFIRHSRLRKKLDDNFPMEGFEVYMPVNPTKVVAYTLLMVKNTYMYFTYQDEEQGYARGDEQADEDWKQALQHTLQTVFPDIDYDSEHIPNTNYYRQIPNVDLMEVLLKAVQSQLEPITFQSECDDSPGQVSD
jgi:hypothetical protein